MAPRDPQSAPGYVLTFDPPDTLIAAAELCELTVFGDTYGNTLLEWDREYGPYHEASVFLAVSEPGGQVVACARLIRPNPVGLKTLNDLARQPWALDGRRAARAAGMDLDATWDVATLAVDPAHSRDGLLAAALHHGLYHVSRANGIRFMVAMLDVRVRRLLSAIGLELTLLPGARVDSYLGSQRTAPVWADLPRMYDLQRKIAPESYRLITLGGGLGNVSLPAPEHYRLTDSPRRNSARQNSASVEPPPVARRDPVKPMR